QLGNGDSRSLTQALQSNTPIEVHYKKIVLDVKP
ncbi:hypothetical protein AVEN_148768-1, partial [Araneus ventricosus]